MIRDLASSGGDCGAPVRTELRVSSVRLDLFDYGGPALADRKALGMVKSFLVTVSPEEFEELVAGDVTLERMLELMNRQVGTVYTMLANAASNYGLQPVLASDVADAADLAERFQPRLYFDSSERFRPLSVDAAFAEAVAGAPRTRAAGACRRPASRSPRRRSFASRSPPTPSPTSTSTSRATTRPPRSAQARAPQAVTTARPRPTPRTTGTRSPARAATSSSTTGCSTDTTSSSATSAGATTRATGRP
jgi:hypothetical protein